MSTEENQQETNHQESTTEEQQQTEQASAENQEETQEATPWDSIFPGKTPEDVKADLQEWKQHSREWEKRAKTWKKQVDTATNEDNDMTARVEAIQADLATAQRENLMYRDLIAMEIEHGTPVNISQLADSIAFRDAYKALDRDSDEFADKLKEIVDKRSTHTTRSNHGRVEVGGVTQSAGADLYDRMYNTKKEHK